MSLFYLHRTNHDGNEFDAMETNAYFWYFIHLVCARPSVYRKTNLHTQTSRQIPIHKVVVVVVVVSCWRVTITLLLKTSHGHSDRIQNPLPQNC